MKEEERITYFQKMAGSDFLFEEKSKKMKTEKNEWSQTYRGNIQKSHYCKMRQNTYTLAK